MRHAALVILTMGLVGFGCIVIHGDPSLLPKNGPYVPVVERSPSGGSEVPPASPVAPAGDSRPWLNDLLAAGGAALMVMIDRRWYHRDKT